jgi:hypothetical protein
VLLILIVLSYGLLTYGWGTGMIGSWGGSRIRLVPGLRDYILHQTCTGWLHLDHFAAMFFHCTYSRRSRGGVRQWLRGALTDRA